MSGEEKRADPLAVDDLDLSGFAPVARRAIAPRDQIRVVSEASGFPSRAPENSKPQQRRHRTGRNLQLNLKVTAETILDREADLASRQALQILVNRQFGTMGRPELVRAFQHNFPPHRRSP